MDISKKPSIYREATAVGRIRLKKSTLELVRKGKLEKGDAVSLAAIASILAAKRTPDIVALAHPIRTEKIEPQVRIGRGWIEVEVKVGAYEKTGVEMEALAAVSVGLLNVWDVVKAYEKDPAGQYPTTSIGHIRVLRKVKGSR